MLDIGAPRFNGDGSFAGYVGCCIDISDQKAAKAVLTDLSSRLIRAQEEERESASRASCTTTSIRGWRCWPTEFRNLDQAVSAHTNSLQKNELREIWRLTNEIATDVQHISHQLHPSKLHYLGLAATVRDLCKEVAQQHKLEVECTVKDLPVDLDDNISLNLFRTVQESLHNVVKHSRAHHVKVGLTSQASVIELRVSDDGVGFNPEQVSGNHGLGLVSMRERMRSVGGEFSIWSRPFLGTQVEGRVPVANNAAKKNKVDDPASDRKPQGQLSSTVNSDSGRAY